MSIRLAFTLDSKNNDVWKEEKALYEFYSNHDDSRTKSGEAEFHFHHMGIMQFSSGRGYYLKNPILKAPTDECNCFVLTAEPYDYGLVIARPCDIPKFAIPTNEDPDEVAFIAREVALRMAQEKNNPR